MPGLLSDDGYIYQRKVVIYHLLEALWKKDLASCKIELKCVTDATGNVTYSIDFFIKTNSGKDIFHEVKKKKNLYDMDQLKPIMKDFYRLFVSNKPQDSEFILIHSCQLTGRHFPNLHAFGEQKRAAVKAMDKTYPDDFCERVSAKQMLDTIDPIIMNSNIDRLSIGIVDKILKEYNIMVYGAAESVYQSIRTCVENIESYEAEKQKKRSTEQLGVTYPITDSVTISLDSLLDHNGSFFDKIAPGFENRLEAKKDFYTRFSVPGLPLPATATIEIAAIAIATELAAAQTTQNENS